MSNELEKSGFIMKDSTYKKLTTITQIWLPAIGFFYLSFATIWNLPFGTEIGATITALAAVFGIMLGISKGNYNGQNPTYPVSLQPGDLQTRPGTSTYRVAVDVPQETVHNNDSINVKLDASQINGPDDPESANSI